MRKTSANSKSAKSLDPSAIVGIGSAAGGLKALEQLFQDLPADLGLALVVVQHINYDGSDMLLEAIHSFTSLPVTKLSDTPTTLKADHIYVVPEHCHSVLRDEGLTTKHEEAAELRAAVVDSLFQALAESKETPIVGILLSGDGHDGTLGLKAISKAGGLTIAQHPDSAVKAEMPRSAVLAGIVDHVLPPQKMQSLLLEYVNHLAHVQSQTTKQTKLQQIKSVLPRICETLLEATEHDFRRYKVNTLVRRISRRMQVLRLATADEYLDHIQSHREEAQTLFQDLLTSVTEFFRDQDVFVSLANLVIPKLLEKAKENRSLRVWVPGCASGEEVYTLAMLIREGMAHSEQAEEIEVQLFGTDIDHRALNVARHGKYPLSIAKQMTAQRLDRFFTKTENQYEVVKEIRDLCVFSFHNLISDPPYSQMDLISCRNLLIYLGQPLQLKLIPLFHFALRPAGYLLLGPSENLAAHTEIFRPIDRRHRISQRKPGPASPKALSSSQGALRNHSSKVIKDESNEVNVHQISQRIVLDEFAPRYAVVNEDAHLVCSSTGLERYFEFTEGPFQNNVIKMVKPGLRSGLRASLRKSRETLQTVTRGNLTFKTDNGLQRVELVVQPMPEIGEQSKLYMLVFRDVGTVQQDAEHADINIAIETETTITQLERELDQTRTDLEEAMHALETTNEELKSSNEELLSMNEVLLTANEELKTSKAEVQTSVEALSRSRSDLENLLTGIKIATIFLDQQGIIKSFTPSAADIFNIKTGDVGRPLSDLTHRAEEMPELPSVGRILSTMREPPEIELRTTDGRWFTRRVLPYKNQQHVAGVILTFVEISEQKRTSTRLAVAHDVTQLLSTADSFEEVAPAVLEAVRCNLEVEFCALWLIAPKTEHMYCAELAYDVEASQIQEFVEKSRLARIQKGERLAGHVWETQEPHWTRDVGELENFLRKQSAQDCGFECGAATPILTGKRVRGVIELFSVRPIADVRSLLTMLDGVGHEIGQFIRRKRADDLFRDAEARKTAILEAALDCIVTMDIQGNIVDFNAAAETTFQTTRQAVLGQQLAEVIIPEEFREAHRQGLRRFLETGESNFLGKRNELTALRSDGTQFPVELSINVSTQRDGTPFFTAYLRDITEREIQQSALEDSEGRAQALVAAASQMVWTAESDGKIVEDSPGWREFTGQTFEQWRGEGWINAVHPEDREQTLKIWAEAQTALEPIAFEYRLRHLSGEYRWNLVRAVPQLRADGSLSRWVGMNTDIHEQKQWEDQLADREAHLRRVIDNMIGFVGVLDTEGTLLEANATALKSGGLTRKDVIGEKFWDCYWWNFDPTTQEQLRDSIRRASQGETVRYDVTVRMAGDTRLEIDFMLAPVTNDDGKVQYLIPSGVDIQERREAERRLADAKLRMDLALEVAQVATWSWDKQTNQPTTDENLNRLFGFEPDENPDLDAFLGRMHEADRDRVAAAIEQSLQTGEPYEEEYRVCLPSGEKRWLHARGHTQRSSDGGFEDFLGVLTDITNSKEAEQRLAESEKRLRMALAAGNMSAWEWTPKESIWAESLFELLGLPTDATPCPETFFQQVHEDDLAGLQEAWEKATRGEQPYNHTFRIRLSDGTVRWLSGAGEMERDSTGQVTRIYGLNWDVTREHEVLAALRESELQAQQANVAKSEFIANMSHEIRTPMTAVMGYADLLAAQEADAEKSEYLQTIKRNGSFLLEIINDILDLSKIEAEKMEVVTEHFSLSNLIADVHSTMNVRAGEKGLDFHIEYDSKIPEQVESDRKRVRQILVNLVGNAIKFTERGSVRLVVRFLPEESPPSVQFQVIDTGIGIAPQEQSQLFQAFSQADPSVSRNFGGTGLGLAISQRLARLLNGKIALESVPEVGSTFTCQISVGNIQGIPLIVPIQDSMEQGVDSQRSDLRLQCRVLVVDDRRDVRFLTNRILTDAGAEVSVAEDGAEALHLVREEMNAGQAWDLILLDMQMPRLDGYQTAEQLRKMDFDRPIIALTADAMQGDMEQCLRSGCNAYLSKPIDAKQLVEVVAHYTRQTSKSHANHAQLTSESLRVLVVDDSVDACQAMQKLLELEGFEAQTAFDGNSALSAAVQLLPDIVLLDLMLPDMSGYEVLEKLKSMPSFGQTKFIALTGDSRSGDSNKWRKVDFDHHLTKPADFRQLLTLLREDKRLRT